MARLGINTGSTPNDGTGDTLVDGGFKINTNFVELYNLLGDGTNLSPGIVTSIVAGDNITINQQVGEVTITGGITTAEVRANTLNVTGVSTLGSSNGIGTVTIGIGTTALLVDGNTRVLGILTVGRDSVTIDGSGTDPFVQVGGGVTIMGTSGGEYIMVGSNMMLDAATGIITATEIHMGNETLTGVGNTLRDLTVTGVSTFNNSVGIGTDNITAPLTVMSSTTPEIRIGYNNSQDHTIAWDSSKLFLNADPDNANGNSAIGFRIDGDEKVRIKSDGKTGIGTDSPDFRLHSGEYDGPSIAGLFETNQNDSFISFQASGTTASSTVRIGATGNDFVAFIDGGERVRVTAGGSFGIGTDDPDRMLSVSDQTNGKLARFIGPTNNLFIMNDRSGIIDLNSTGTGDHLCLGTQDTERVRITSGGNVGIGTDNPNTELEVFSDTFSDITINSARTSGNIGGINFRKGGVAAGILTAQLIVDTDGAYHFYSQGTEKVHFDGSGTVTIHGVKVNNRPRIIFSTPDESTNYRHLFGANLQVDAAGTYTTPATNISGGGWQYESANNLNNHGSMIYLSAPDTNTESSTPLERLRIDDSGRVGINTNSPNAQSQLNVVGSSYWPILVKTTSSNGGGVAIKNPDDVTSLYTGTGGSSWLTGSSATDGLVRAGNTLLFAIGNSEKMRIDSSGSVLVNTNTARQGFYNGPGTNGTLFQVEGTDYLTSSLSVTRNSDNNAGSTIILAKSRGASVNSFALIENGDTLGRISFQGAGDNNASQYSTYQFAEIKTEVSKAPLSASNKYTSAPGALVFSTAPNTTAGGGEPSDILERMRIDDTGKIILSNDSTGIQFGTPDSGGSVSSQTLDDYEEGTWTSVLSSSGATVAGNSIYDAYDYQIGTYTKIGDTVIASFRVKLSSPSNYTNGGASGQSVYVAGLPFLPNTSPANLNYTGAISYVSGLSGTWTSFNLDLFVNNTNPWGHITYMSTTSSTSFTTTSVLGGFDLIGHMIYRAA